VWILIAGYFFFALLGIYIFWPDGLTFGTEQFLNLAEVPEHAALSMIWLQLFAMTACLIAIVRRRDLLRLSRSSWSWRRTVGQIVLWVMLARVVTFLAALRFHVPAVESIQIRWLLAFGREYGAWSLLALVVIVVPILEEIAFRGVLLDGIRRHHRFWVANITQGATFALLHEDARFMPALFLIGLVCGRMRFRSEGLVVPVCLHSANNLLAYLQLLPSLH